MLRELLLDCRSTLRRATFAFHETDLRTRLDAAIQALSGKQSALKVVLPPETRTAQQVAYAWQMTTRDLRFSHPELYADLAHRVSQLLAVESLADPVTEIHRLQTRATTSAAAGQALVLEMNELRQVLAEAVPHIKDSELGPSETARLRVQALVDQRSKVPAIPLSTRQTSMAPTRECLQAVLKGMRKLTRDESDWCVAEAMVLCGFQKTPVQLLAEGEVELARLILDAQTLSPER